jgi:hypothetical protein
MENLTALKFDEHLRWPQGPGKPALISSRGDEPKKSYPLSNACLARHERRD